MNHDNIIILNNVIVLLILGVKIWQYKSILGKNLIAHV